MALAEKTLDDDLAPEFAKVLVIRLCHAAHDLVCVFVEPDNHLLELDRHGLCGPLYRPLIGRHIAPIGLERSVELQLDMALPLVGDPALLNPEGDGLLGHAKLISKRPARDPPLF